jgi:DNA helicase-2/ATP-dependent DNA helicase PcrA
MPHEVHTVGPASGASLEQSRELVQPMERIFQRVSVLRVTGVGDGKPALKQRVLELRDEGKDLGEMAVLYRSHFHALELQLELTRRNIPFSITSGIRFFEQAHIKDVTAYLKLVTNPRDELSFKRIVQLLPGVGGKDAHAGRI